MLVSSVAELSLLLVWGYNPGMRRFFLDLNTYLSELIHDWIALMSGVLGVVLAFVGVYVSTENAKGALFLTAAIAIMLSSFRIWKKQRALNKGFAEEENERREKQDAVRLREASAKEDAGRPRFKLTSRRLPGDEWENIEIWNIGLTPALDLKLTCDGIDKGQAGILRPGKKIDRQVRHNNESHDFCLFFRTEFGSQWSIVQGPYGAERVVEVLRPDQI